MTDSFVPDRPVICPYDSNHSIAQSRFQRHIIKCSKNFPPNYKLSCPYNATHRLAKTEMEAHIRECSDRKYVDPVIYDVISSGGSTTNYEMEDRSVIHCEESWDEEDGTLYELSSISDLDDSSKPLLRINSWTVPTKPLVEQQTLIRQPLGRSEALMIEESGDSAVEDIESVTSFMGIGRGKPAAYRNNEKLLRMIGKGRGSSSQKNGI